MESNALSDGDPEEFYETCVRPFIAALVDNLEERFPEDSIAVMDAADVFDPIKAASSSSPESRYKYGRNEVKVQVWSQQSLQIGRTLQVRTNYSPNRVEGV